MTNEKKVTVHFSVSCLAIEHQNTHSVADVKDNPWEILHWLPCDSNMLTTLNTMSIICIAVKCRLIFSRPH
jgi:hypothetical protein